MNDDWMVLEPSTPGLVVHRKTFHPRKFGAYVASHMHRDQEMTDAFLVDRLTTMVLSDHLVGDSYTTNYTHDVEVPASWWQMFRRDVLKRPHRTTKVRNRGTVTVRFDRYALYPGADVTVPSDRFGYPVIYEVAEEITP